jgi:hypothetical protein
MVGWTEESVEKIIRRYVGHAAYTKALIRQINERMYRAAAKSANGAAP